MKQIINEQEIYAWSFYHIVTLGHQCDSIKDYTGINIAWVDTVTGERIYIVYSKDNTELDDE